MSFWAYVLRCSDGAYYTGHTDNLEHRIAQHHAGEIEGYTRSRRPVELMWSESFPSREEAIAAELQIKDWSRAKKEALFRSDWQSLSRLAKPPRHPSRHDVSTSSTSARSEREEARTASLEQTGRELDEDQIAPPPAIVLARPQLGENIGKAARAMLNFGLTDLRLVNPRDGWPNPSAGPAASGADVVLERARVFDTVAEAVADCAHVYATTVRKRGLVVPVVTPEEAAREIRQQAGPSAILFGAERSGLETEEVAIAEKIVTVPINPEFRSLNLAQAVILVAYEWSKHETLLVPTQGEEQEPPATHDQLEGLIGQMDQALDEAGYYFPPDRTPATRLTMRTILSKARWSNREIQAMRGMLRALVNARQR